MSSAVSDSFILREPAVDVLVNDVRRYGAARVETGAFLLGRRDSAMADVVALAGAVGIARSSQRFSVSARAIAALFDWAAREDIRIHAQVHSHSRAAFLSRSDIRHGFAVPEFVTSVVPWFASPPPDHSDWGWWRYERRWREIAAPGLRPGMVRVVVFDETGIRDV